jgi:hypothetical protein
LIGFTLEIRELSNFENQNWIYLAEWIGVGGDKSEWRSGCNTGVALACSTRIWRNAEALCSVELISDYRTEDDKTMA